MTEKEKYFQWLDRRIDDGLKHISYTVSAGAFKLKTEEEIFKHLNDWNDAEIVPDPLISGSRNRSE